MTPSSRTSARSPIQSAKDRPAFLGSLVVVAGVVVTVPIYLVIYHEQSLSRSAAALSMPTMGMQNMDKFWSFPILQATGLAGLIFAWVSVFLGLQQSGRVAGWLRLNGKQVDRLHRYVSLLVITEVALHVGSTLLDAMGDSWRTVFLLNQWSALGWPQADWAYDAGVIAMYVLAVTAPSFYVRRGIGVRRWRVLHRLVIVFYVLSVWHALIIGADVERYGWIRPTIWLAQIPLLLLLIRRVQNPARTAEVVRGGSVVRAIRRGIVALGAASTLAVLGIVLSNNMDAVVHSIQ